MTVQRSVRLRRWSLALGASVVAMGTVAVSPAQAQCSPDPTVANGITNCTGTDPNGLSVTTSSTTVNVLANATVSSSGGPAIAVQVIPASNVSSNYTALSIAGHVDGGSQAGARLLWQPATNGFGYYESRLAMTVLAGGVVTGANGIVVGQSASGFGNAYVSIDNAGTITGTGGIALLSTAPGFTGFSSIINRAGGIIGAISAPVGTVTNAGRIDGGTRSAIDWGTVYGPVFGDITNSGTITAASSAATLAGLPSGRTIANSGSIANTGIGAAIAGDGLTLTNAAGGRIATAGTVAVRTSTSVSLVNRGTIDGDVVTTASPLYAAGSQIDSSAGTINGSVTFGAGSDTLTADYAGGRLVTGITGSIDGGAGTDMVRIAFRADTTIAAAIPLPTNFEQVTLAPATGVTATLVDGFAGSIRIAGGGTIVNRTTLSDTTQVVTTDFGSSESPTFINAGTLRTTAAGPIGSYALNLQSGTRFDNSGSVDAAGDGVLFSSQGTFNNSGTITAAGTAVSIRGSGFSNSGAIRSTGGIGAILSGSSGDSSTNSGRLEGAVGGASLRAGLVNTGTITSTGTGVILDSYGILDNRAGGIVSGGSRAIGPQSLNSYVFNATVANAGTIDGDVVLTGQSFGFSSNYNRYFALPGGVLNGKLTLNNGDVLVTEFTNTGTGAFAGITGTVSARNASLIYRVRQDASATIVTPAGFDSIGYELVDKATLTLTGSTSPRPLTLAGQGIVDLAADITTTSQPAISTTSKQVAPGETYLPNALAVTSRGTLTLTRTDTSSYPYGVAILGSADTFVNAGTIVARDQAGTVYSQLSAIAGGKSVTNDGTITLDGTTGVQGTQNVINTGTIGQVAGGRAATGVRASVGTTTLVNSGTIDVAGNAVIGDYYGLTITNSGRIASSAATAITLTSYGSAIITNLADGTIAGGNGQAIRLSGGAVTNTGTITGSVDLGYSDYGRSFQSAIYTANGGTLAGDLRFGDGDDIFVSVDGAVDVSGTIAGGAGNDTYRQARTTNGTVTIGGDILPGFEREDVQAIGADTVVTIRADATVGGDLSVSGDGRIVNTADINGMVRSAYLGYISGYTNNNSVMTAFANQAVIKGGFVQSTASFTNTGMIGTDALQTNAVSINQTGDLSFSNEGRIVNAGIAGNVSGNRTVRLSAIDGSITATNSGTIDAGGLRATVSAYQDSSGVNPAGPLTVSLVNSGTITGNDRAASLSFVGTGTGSATLDNSGTIEAIGQGAIGAYVGTRYEDGVNPVDTVSVTNSGTIRANGDGIVDTYSYWFNPITYRYTVPTSALYVIGAETDTATITNATAGVIEATGNRATAISAYEIALDLTNAGTVRGGAGTVLADDDLLVGTIGSTTLAGAIQTTGVTDDRIVNTGTIIGSIALGAGNDRIENTGRIEGDVFLAAGDDSFLHRASATLIGTVDAGIGDDSLVIDATGGGTVRAAQFINFERFSQIGAGAVQYVGAFRAETLGVSGGTVTVAAGETLSSTGAVTVTGSDAAETVLNDGTIAGSVALGAGNDRLVNAGTITGAVLLGDGDDGFVERAGSRVAGGVDGGAGTDRYTVALAGDRSGIGTRSGFELLGVEGNGTLTLALDQSFDAVTLAGTGLTLTLGGNRVGAVTGSDARETLSVDGDVAQVSLGAGDDVLALGTATAAGRYAGGTGTDTLRFTAPGTTTLAGTATGFEQVALTGPLVVTGTLGSTGAPLSFGAGDQQLTIADGGTLAGTIDLGAGNDGFRLAANAVLDGTVAGGAGDDSATLVLAGARTLAAATLTGFETLATEGAGTLTLTGSHGYDRVLASGNLAIGAGAGLTARDLRFSGVDNRLTIAGGFAGAVDGGAGTDTIAVSGGSAAAPVAFSTIANVEALAMSGGFATIAGNAALGSVDLTGGRLVGLEGSVLRADRIAVAQGATFGSAGTVTGNLTVAGILSPGASPGTMTVNGNVALAMGARALFELTPTVSDRLVVNGALSIAGGTTLEIVASGALRPGTSYDLITASGGITGAFATVVKPADLFGFIVQRADRIQLLGQFLGDARFAPQVARSIAYANATLAVQPATSTLFAALPALVEPSGASNARGFAQLTPEAYATATQLGVDHALALGQAARGPAFATTREEAGLFTFAQTLGQWHRLAGDPAQGSAGARSQSYGFLGGLGFGDRDWSVGAFAGYLNGRQQIEALGARTRADGAVAGVQGRYTAPQGWGFAASLLYDGGKARTDRTLPGGRGAGGRYDLHSWVSDLSAHYAADIAGGWMLQPRLGVTYVRTTRDGVTEGGTNPFALRVARDRHVAGFADAGLSFARSEASDAALRPFVSLGARYQIEGRRVDALAGYAGGALGLTGVGASRAQLVGTAAGGIGYRLTSGLDLFTTASAQTGRDDHQETITTGVRLRF